MNPPYRKNNVSDANFIMTQGELISVSIFQGMVLYYARTKA